MKVYYILFIFLIIFFKYDANAQWDWVNPLPQGNWLEDITFTNELEGYAVGYRGTIIQTTNGGLEWYDTGKVTYNDLEAVHFVDSVNGFIVGQNGTILKTTNKGGSWNIISGIPSSANFKSVYFTSTQIGFAVGSPGAVFKTTNSGQNWSAININFSNKLNSVFFINQDEGWIVGDWLILHSTDSGNNWVQVNPGSSFRFEKVEFFNLDNGYISYDEFILRTTDRGSNWFSVPVGIHTNDFHFITDQIGWACGEWGLIAKTTNAGMSWVMQSVDSSSRLTGIFFTNTDNGFCISSRAGKIFSTLNSGTDWTQYYDGYYGGCLDLVFIDENIGFIASEGGVVKSTDGGLNWTVVESTIGMYLHSLFFVNDNVGWSCGLDGSIVKTTDGGDNWFSQNSGTFRDLQDIFFASDTVGYAVGYKEILKTVNGGDNWIQLLAPFNSWGYAVNFTDENHGVVGGQDFLIRTVDGGNTWFIEDNHDLRINDLSFINSDEGWAGGGDADYADTQILKTIDGGDNWIELSNPNLGNCSSIQFLNSETGWALSGSNIIKTTNGGDDWQITTLASPYVRQLFFHNQSIGWIGGSYVILKTINDDIPVELISFRVSLNNSNTVNMIWSTATEINNRGFEIERTIDNNKWERIGFINGQGTTSTPQSYSFIDTKSPLGKVIYRLKQIDFNGTFEYSESVTIDVPFPNNYFLQQNYPNPFNPSTIIKYQIPEKSLVVLKLYDVLGSEVSTLVNEEKSIGKYEAKLNAISLPSGVYFYRLQAGSFVETKKMLLLK